MEYPVFFWGGKGEGRGGRRGGRGFLFSFLAFFFPSSLPSFLARHDRLFECAFALLLFLLSFFSGSRRRCISACVVRGPHTLQPALQPRNSTVCILHLALLVHLFIHSSMSFMFMSEESCTEVYVMFKARLYGHHWVGVKERAWDWYWVEIK